MVVAKHLNSNLSKTQRVLPTPHVYYTHLNSSIFDHSCVRHESRILAFHSPQWLLVYFSLYFMCFEIINNVRISYSHLFKRKCSSFMLHLQTWWQLLMIACEANRLSSTDLPRRVKRKKELVFYYKVWPVLHKLYNVLFFYLFIMGASVQWC